MPFSRLTVLRRSFILSESATIFTAAWTKVLSTRSPNELAVVLKPAADKANAERPFVRVITDPQGNPVDHGREVDLTEKDETGDFRDNIIRLIDNTEYKFDTCRYFV